MAGMVVARPGDAPREKEPELLRDEIPF